MVFAVLALAGVGAGDPGVVALAIFFLALGLLAGAAVCVLSGGFGLDFDLGLLDEFLVLGVVVAAVAGALGRAGLARVKALAVSLEAVSLLAGAPSLLALGVRGRERGGIDLFDFDGQGILIVGVGGQWIEVSEGVVGQILDGFDHEKRVLESVEGGQPVEQVLVPQRQH